MTLEAPTRLGSYEIIALIGSGGMGEVYRARDGKLDREVAVKLLPEAFWRDAERRSRLEREARLLAALNHPGIASIYGLEEQEGVRFLVMELIPGETLAEKIARGPVELKEALSLFQQLAEALEAAHQKGIIHRDLKPQNLKLTPEGRIKVLDFGLAKNVSENPPGENQSHSPTLTRGTASGVILGTAAYMSPEQARGLSVDSRGDVWAFGCCLYEALSGKKAFSGETTADTLARVLEREPDWEKLPYGTPSPVRALLRKCLQKDPSRRLRDLWDVRVEIEEARAEPSPIPLVKPARRPRRALVAAALFAALSMGWFLGSFGGTSSSGDSTLTRFAIELPAGDRLQMSSQGARIMAGSMVLSADGRKLAYIASDGTLSRLYIRHLDQLEASPVPGTEGALDPFFSPDGESVGFTANGRLHKVSLASGVRTTLSPQSAFPSGASWNDEDTILFSTGRLMRRVPATGGAPLDVISKEGVSYGLPHFLPGGEEALITIVTQESSHIGVLSLESGELKMLAGLGDATTAAYVETGHLVYGSHGRIMAVPFDLEKREDVGSPVPVIDNVYTMPGGRAFYSVSRNGTLAYVPGGEVERSLVVVYRKGAVVPSGLGPGYVAYPRFSPGGSLLTIEAGPGLVRDIWTFDLERGTRRRLTAEGLSSLHSAWSPDGSHIAFGLRNRIVWKAADGSGEIEVLAERERSAYVSSFSPDGRLLAFYEVNHPVTGVDIWVLPLEGDREPFPFLATSFNESDATFSPDGRFIAYTSDESGRFEVYVRPYPGPGGKFTLSTDGGAEARWSRDGKELFYRRGNQVLSVPVETHPAFTAGKPQVLFEGNYDLGTFGDAHYDVSPDGKTFAMVETGEAKAPARINVVLNWVEDLKRLVPTPPR